MAETGTREQEGHPRGAAAQIVAIGASAGGLHALEAVLSALPSPFAAPVVVVQHVDPNHRSLLSEILGRHTELLVRPAEDGVALEPGVVHLAVPDHHLLVNEDRTVSLTHSALVHYSRPSIDLLFESVAGAFGNRAVAVVLTGTGRDGSAGVQAIAERGGTVVVQDPATAEFSAMPQAAVATGKADLVLPLRDVGPALVRLVRGTGEQETSP